MAEIIFNVQSELTRALAQITSLRTRDLPFVAATAINMTMKQVKEDERAEMQKVFDKPAPFTLNSLQTYPYAKKDDLTAVLRFRDFAGKGTPAGKYLAPQIYGGERRLKSFEKQLQQAGILPAGMYAVPALPGGRDNQGAELNQYGNMSGAYLNRVLSYLRANRDSTQNRSAAKGAAKRRPLQWFAVTPVNQAKVFGGGLPLGIYERRSGGFHMVIKFVSPPAYTVRFRFGEVAQASAARHFPGNVTKAAHIAVEALKRNGAQWNVADLLNLWPKGD